LGLSAAPKQICEDERKRLHAKKMLLGGNQLKVKRGAESLSVIGHTPPLKYRSRRCPRRRSSYKPPLGTAARAERGDQLPSPNIPYSNNYPFRRSNI